jgi:hypothetical protein
MLLTVCSGKSGIIANSVITISNVDKDCFFAFLVEISPVTLI